MKRRASAVVCTLLCVVCAARGWSQEVLPPPSVDSVLQAIRTFSDDPLSDAGKVAWRTIALFSIESDSVTVVVSSGVVPWMGREREYPHSTILLAAFVAGNIRSQLYSGVNRDDPYSGLIQVFWTYRLLKEKDRTFSIPGIEELLELHRKGELMKHLLEVRQKRVSEPSTGS